jgi:hypothetical protein
MLSVFVSSFVCFFFQPHRTSHLYINKEKKASKIDRLQERVHTPMLFLGLDIYINFYQLA